MTSCTALSFLGAGAWPYANNGAARNADNIAMRFIFMTQPLSGNCPPRRIQARVGNFFIFATMISCFLNRFHWNWRKDGAGGGSRTHTALRPTDFESAASAIPPLRHGDCKSNLLRVLVQHSDLRRWLLKDAGVSSGVTWLPFRSVQPLYGSKRMLWCQVCVAYRHGDGLVAH